MSANMCYIFTYDYKELTTFIFVVVNYDNLDPFYFTLNIYFC